MGFDTLHIFALDEVLLENRAFYIKALQRVQVEREDLGSWLEFMAEAVLETLERVQKRIQSLGLPGKEPLSLSLRQEKLLRLLAREALWRSARLHGPCASRPQAPTMPSSRSCATA